VKIARDSSDGERVTVDDARQVLGVEPDLSLLPTPLACRQRLALLQQLVKRLVYNCQGRCSLAEAKVERVGPQTNPGDEVSFTGGRAGKRAWP
jgi:hypothetical protein